MACAALSVLAALDHLSSAGKIRRGVYEGDVALGGKTPKDAFEPRPHYIRPGMDATVWWWAPGKADDLDMKFRNTTEGYLLPREYVADDGYVYAEIWGRPDGTGVEMYSEPAYVGADGSEWVTHQKITRGGEVVYDGVLHRDTYEPLVDGKNGEPMPPSEVPAAPVNP